MLLVVYFRLQICKNLLDKQYRSSAESCDNAYSSSINKSRGIDVDDDPGGIEEYSAYNRKDGNENICYSEEKGVLPCSAEPPGFERAEHIYHSRKCMSNEQIQDNVDLRNIYSGENEYSEIDEYDRAVQDHFPADHVSCHRKIIYEL